MPRSFSTITPNSRYAAYVVFEGRKPGIYDNWNDAKKQVHGYSGCKYKGFSTEITARKEYKNYIKEKNKTSQKMVNEHTTRPQRKLTTNNDDQPPWD